MIHINDLTYRLGPRLLFDKATVALPASARVGFVGRNGTGIGHVDWIGTKRIDQIGKILFVRSDQRNGLYSSG